MLEDIQTKARRTLEEIFPAADLAALAEVVHSDCFGHADWLAALPALHQSGT